MRDIGAIRSQSRQAAEAAAREGRVPFVVEREDLGEVKVRSLPVLGSNVPTGWTRVEDIYVNKDSVAETIFNNRLVEGLGYALVHDGAHQYIVGAYNKSSED